jgi:hypothetical protein
LKLHFLGMPSNLSKIYNHLFLRQLLFANKLLIMLLISSQLMYLIHGRLHLFYSDISSLGTRFEGSF